MSDDENIFVFFDVWTYGKVPYLLIKVSISLTPKMTCKSRDLSGSSIKYPGEMTMEVLKVSSRSAPNSVAGAIASVIRDAGEVEVQAVGAGAANQAIKSIAVARGYLAPIGIDLICIPAFASVEIEGEERTAIKLICEKR